MNPQNSLEDRVDNLEERMAKYDAIVTRLDIFIEVLSKHLEETATRVDAAIEGQEILKERNKNAHRWATFGISFASSVVTGVLTALIIYLWPLLVH